jgi:branched-chain amino acid transport system ATP-binding protein
LSAPESLLRLDNVDVRYGGVQALRGISLEVKSGEIVALLGANGAGKTTTLRTISGLVAPSHGQITWQDRRIDQQRPEDIVRLGIAHVPEGRQIFPELTVEENLLIGSYSRTTRDQVRPDLSRFFEQFPKLAARRTQPGGNLSGGEQQMLAIARALMASPKLVLLDEPSMGLAPRTVQEVFALLADLNRAGTALLLVEQNARMALRLAHRAYLLETGRIVLSGTADDLQRNPEVERSYLGLRELVR